MPFFVRRFRNVVVFAVLGGVTGCGLLPMSRSQAPMDPQAEAAQQRVRQHLDLIDGAHVDQSRTSASRAVAEAPVDIIWSDPGFLTDRNRHRPDNPVRPRPAIQPPVAFPAPAAVSPTQTAQASAVDPVASMNRDQLLSLLADRIQQSNDPAMTKALTMAVLSLADPQRRLDENRLVGLTSSQRQQVKRYHALVVELGGQLAVGQAELNVDEVITKLDDLFGRPIEISTFALCRRVDAFGLYHEIDRDHNQPQPPYLTYVSQSRGVGVYLEVDHFQSALEADQHYTVRLSQELKLYTQDGLAVWSVPPTEVVDRSRNRRRDFFTTQVIQLPDDLPPGKYLLKVRVTDRASSSLAEATVPLHHVIERPIATAPPRKPLLSSRP